MSDADSSALADATETFLDDRDDGERALEAVLEVDSASETWTFDDVPLDSGTFGELVSRGIVENVDGEYRVADPEVVAAVLSGEDVGAADASDRDWSFEFAYSIDFRALSALLGALVVVALARMTAYRSVFRSDRVVSPANDPYYFRYWMEALLEDSSGPTDYGVVVDPAHGVSARRPMTHATNWFVAELLGGSQWAADWVAAWSPVVGSVLVGLTIYGLAVVLSRDVRVGVAAVLTYAVTPVNAVYSGLGFLDHEIHQYVWSGVTLFALGWLAVDFARRREAGVDDPVRSHLRSPVTWVVAVALGFAVAAGTHAWGGSPLLLIPLAGYIALRVAMDARADVSPVRANLPVLTGLALGSALSLALHYRWGWHAEFVSATPAMVFGGAVVVAALGEGWRRLEGHAGVLVALEGLVAVVGLYAFRRLRPEEWLAARDRVDDLFFREGATETMSLFSTEYAIIVGPLYQLGVGFYVGLAVLGWVAWIAYRRYEPGWLLVGTYAGYLIVLSGIQVRFAAQLAIPLAVLAGLGFVQLLAVVDLARAPVPFRDRAPPSPGRASRRSIASDGGEAPAPSISLPDGRAAVYVVGIGLLAFGLSLIYVPTLTADVAYSEAQVRAVDAIDDHATEADRTYPDTFVLSEWGDNRMYNYFVNGEAEGYGYARSNYQEFVFDSDPDGWYDRFDGRVGYVVVTAIEDDGVPAESTYVRLLEDLGTGGPETQPLEHYQLLTVDDDRSAAAFAVVPGATLEGSGEPGDPVTVRTDVTVGEETLTYDREVAVGDDGRFAVTVPYAGPVAVGDATVDVGESDVLNGSTLEVDE